jgi:hypothetical protein
MGIYNNHLSTTSSSGPVWVSGQAYNPNDIVVYGSSLYVCLASHTASGAFESDVANWRLANQPALIKNYMSVGSTAEVGTLGGWNTMSVTLSSLIPSGAPTIGAVSSITLTTSSSTPLAGSYSWLLSNTATNNITAGQGIISQAYSIDLLDQAKVLAQKFAYKALSNPSGATSMNFSGTSSNTFAVYIYDVTNSAWIQPAGVYNLVQSSGVGTSTGTFQTPSNMTQFRIAIICINSTTATTPAVNTYQMQFDDFFVGPQPTMMAPAMSDWQSYNASLLNLGGFTVNRVYSYWRRVGDSLEAIARYTFTGGPPTGASTVVVSIPSGFVPDTSKGVSTVGTEQYGTFRIPGSTSFFGSVSYNSNVGGTHYFSMCKPNTQANIIGTDFAGASSLDIYIRVPITGWSSNTVSSADTDTRVVAARVYRSGALTFSPNANSAQVTYDTILNDETASYSTTNGNYVIPVSGWYEITASLGFANGNWLANLYSLSLKVGPIFSTAPTIASDNKITRVADATTYYRFNVTTRYKFNAGDVVWVDFFGLGNNSAAPLTVSTTQSTYFSISRVSGPAVVQASESVSALYTGAPATGTLSAGYNKTTFGTRVKDTHNAYSSGVYTVPVSGVYSISAEALVLATYALNNTNIIGIFVGGVQKYIKANRIAGAVLYDQVLLSVHGVPLNAGDQVEIRMYNDATSPSYGGSADTNFFSIVRTGN